MNLCKLSILLWSLMLVCERAQALSDEENLALLVRLTRREIFQITREMLPPPGMTLKAATDAYHKPREMYLPNADGIRELHFDLSARSEANGLKTVMPATLHIVFRNDLVVDSFFTFPSHDTRNTKLTADAIGKENDHLHSKYLLDVRLLEMLRTIKVNFDLNFKKTK